MQILVVNSGSSSIKFWRYVSGPEGGEPRLLLEGEIAGIGGDAPRLTVEGEASQAVKAGGAVEAIRAAFDTVDGAGLAGVGAVGYRVVHPGPRLKDHQRVTPEVVRELEAAAAFAPLHDPEAVEVIREGMRRYPGVEHYVCFDTVFHQTMPEEATRYAIPERFWDAGVRRYGFHGLSLESVVRRMGTAVPRRMVIAHLGSGCSVTALVEGRSVDTTMGLTPTGGVVMGTRPGDLDPGLVIYLARQVGLDGVETMLNHEAGMVGLTGMENDLKAVRKTAEAGDEGARMGLKVFTRSVTKAIGGFCWGMGGLDAVVFTGGIGEHDAGTRREILEGLEELGFTVNSSANECVTGDMRVISASQSRAAVLVVPAQEDLAIAMHVDRLGRMEASS